MTSSTPCVSQHDGSRRRFAQRLTGLAALAACGVGAPAAWAKQKATAYLFAPIQY